MRGDFSIEVVLPLSQLTVELGPLSLRSALQRQHEARETPRPAYLSEKEWVGIHDLAARVRRFGEQPGITVEELLDLADADTSVLMDGVTEVAKREAGFRGLPTQPVGGDGAGGEGDKLAAGDPAGDGRG